MMKHGLWMALLLALILSLGATAAETVGEWKLQLAMGDQTSEATLIVKDGGDGLSGTWKGQRGTHELEQITWDGKTLKFSWKARRKTVEGTATVSGDSLQGTMSTPRGRASFTGQRAGH